MLFLFVVVPHFCVSFSVLREEQPFTNRHTNAHLKQIQSPG